MGLEERRERENKNAHVAADRANVDDLAALARGHVRDHGARHTNDAEDVGVERPLYALVIHVDDGSW